MNWNQERTPKPPSVSLEFKVIFYITAIMAIFLLLAMLDIKFEHESFDDLSGVIRITYQLFW